MTTAKASSGGDNAPENKGTEKNTASAKTRPDFVKAVFIGHNGYTHGRNWFFPMIWLSEFPISKTGELIPTRNPDGLAVNPEVNPEFSHWAPPSFTPGDVVFVPSYNDTLYTNAVNTNQFAYEAFADRVNKWIDEGVTGEEIYQLVLKEDGMLKPFEETGPTNKTKKAETKAETKKEG